MKYHQREPFSTHAFMMPLRWEYIPDGVEHQLNFDSRTDLKRFNDILTEGRICYWKRAFYRIDENTTRYNELTYFHHYARQAIYDIQERDEDNEHIISKNKMILHYQWPISKSDYYEIHCPVSTYKLQLDELNLYVFTTGVLILAYNCSNFLYRDEKDILHINEFGRRYYPQFLDGKEPHLTQKVKQEFLASRIDLKISSKGHVISEDFLDFDSFRNLRTPEFRKGRYTSNSLILPPAFLTELFPDKFVYNGDDHVSGTIRLRRITDDRMFYICWYGSQSILNELASKCKINGNYEYSYVVSDFWYSFIFGDKDTKSASIHNEYMKVEETKKHTYSRWIDPRNERLAGTLFGITRDSFTCLSGWDLTRIHMNTMYYRLAVLCLAQRSSILNFSAEVVSLGNLTRDKERVLPSLIKNLYVNYIEFINKLYFREVTSQIQGIDMYSHLQTVMNIHRDVHDLDLEIEELHRFANLIIQEDQTREAVNLTKVAAIFLPSTLIAAILGMNIFDNLKWSTRLDINDLSWTILALLPLIIMSAINWSTVKTVFYKRS